MKNFTRRFLLGTATALLIAGTSAASAMDKFILFDFVELNDGMTVEDRTAYENDVQPILTRYGLNERHGYNLMAHLGGKMENAVRLKVWEMPDPSALQAVLDDSEYKTHVDKRDAIHNMRDLSLYIAKDQMDKGPITDAAVLVDLVVMNKGFGSEERAEYEAAIEPIAAKHGLTKIATYPVLQKANGIGPDDALQLNLWRVADPKGLEALFGDPEFAKLTDMRNKLHNFDELTLFMASPNQ